MKRLFGIVKRIILTLVAIVVLFTLVIILFVNMSSQFGENPDRDQLRTFQTVGNYSDGKFQNQVPTKLGLTFGQMASVMREFFFGNLPGKNPEGPLPMVKVDSSTMADRSHDISRLTWFGHSAVLLELDGKKILLDPMLGQHAGPLPRVSPRRYNKELPIDIEQLPFIDVVVISHDHYDHLDYGSILKLKHKVGRFYAPLGVGAHLKSWGVNPEIITELNWWEEASFDGFTLICTPARHFSGRAFTNNKTLWCSWVIRTTSRQIFFSGDSGYGPHFKEIGDRYGAMDLVMMECGQYNELWKAIHMMPEQTVRATLDVKGKLLMPIHWGAFTLAMHPWTDPVERAARESDRLGVPLITPKIGQAIDLDHANTQTGKWW